MKPKPQVGSTFQVLLRGPRVRAEPQPVLRERICEVFRVSEEHAGRILDWRGVLRQGLNLSAAIHLATLLRRCGLDARVTPTTTRGAATQPPPDLTGDRLGAFLDSPAFHTSVSPPSRPGRVLLSLRLLPAAALALLLVPGYFALTFAYAASWGAYLAEIGGLVGAQGILMPMLALLIVAGGGTVILGWLLVPLWLGPRPRPARLAVSAKGCPALYALLDACSRVVQASRPIQVELTLEPRIRLHAAGGFSHWIHGRTRLSIGLPVLAVANTGELSGLIAGALGLSTRRGSWRLLSLIIGSMDGLEDHLQGCERRQRQLEGLRGASLRPVLEALLDLALLGMKLSEGITRGVLALLQWVSRPAMAELMTQTDQYAVALVGSQPFARSLLRLRALELASDEVLALNRSAWRSRRLLRDLPMAIHEQFQSIDESQWQAIDAELHRTGSGSWHTPALAERLAIVEGQRIGGRYMNPQPARKLVPGFHGITIELTARRYTAEGLVVEAEQFVEPSAVLPREQARGREQTVLHRYFNGQFRPWPLIDLQDEKFDTCSREQWQSIVDQLRAHSPEATRTWARTADLEQRRARLRLVSCYEVDPVLAGVPDFAALPVDKVEEQLENIRQRQLPIQRQLRHDQAEHARRIACAIAVMPDRTRQEAEQLRDLLEALRQCEPDVSGLQEIVQAARLLQTLRSVKDRDVQLHFRQLSRDARGHAARLLQQAQHIAQNVLEGDTVHGLLLKRCPDAPLHAANPLRFISHCSLLIDAFQMLYQQALARLVMLCETAEQEHGITPICRLQPEPAEVRQPSPRKLRKPRVPLGGLATRLPVVTPAARTTVMSESVPH